MDREFWYRRWRKNEIGFHLADPHHFLQKYFPLLQTQPADRIFVPLCGKSPDLVWLRGKGLEVIGIELSRIAVEAFFDENGLPGRWTDEAPLSCCSAEGYQLYCGDFFRLPAQALTGVNAYYDRGALVALPPEMRVRYAARLAKLMSSSSRMLLVSYSYNQSETNGPPFSVPQQELQTLFAEKFQIEFLSEEDVLWSHQGLIERGVTQLTEHAVLLIKK